MNKKHITIHGKKVTIVEGDQVINQFKASCTINQYYGIPLPTQETTEPEDDENDEDDEDKLLEDYLRQMAHAVAMVRRISDKRRLRMIQDSRCLEEPKAVREDIPTQENDPNAILIAHETPPQEEKPIEPQGIIGVRGMTLFPAIRPENCTAAEARKADNRLWDAIALPEKLRTKAVAKVIKELVKERIVYADNIKFLVERQINPYFQVEIVYLTFYRYYTDMKV